MRRCSILPAIVLALCGLSSSGGELAAQWTPMPSISDENRSAAFVAYLDGTLYAFGGIEESNGPTANAYKLDIASGSWSPIAPLPRARFYGYAAAIGGRIYLFGGVIFRNGVLVATEEVLAYDPASDSYSTRAPMPLPTYYAAGAVVGNRVFILGGMRSGAPAAISQMYDAASDSWAQITETPLPRALIGAAATSVGATLYLVGGSGDQPTYASAWRGVPSADGRRIAWEAIADYPFSVYQAAAGPYNARCYVAGGRRATNQLVDDVYYYDETGNRWRPGYSMPLATNNNSPNMAASSDALFFLSAENGRGRNWRYSEVSLDAIAEVSQRQFALSAERGGSDRAVLRVRNRGIVPLTGSLDIPAAAAWLGVQTTTLNVEPGMTQSFELTGSATALAAGDYRTTLTLRTNDASQQAVPIVVAFFVREDLERPVRTTLVEVGTGDWCGHCPAAERILAGIMQRLGDSAVIVEYHGGSRAEPMLLNEGQELLDRLGIPGFPSAAINRIDFPDQPATMVDRSNWSAFVDSARTDIVTPAGIELRDVVYDVTVSATAVVRWHEGLALADGNAYALTAVVVEDSLLYSQTEYVDTGTVFHEQWYHSRVARAIYPSPGGQPLTFTGTIEDSIAAPGAVATLPFEFFANVRSPERARLVAFVHTIRGGAIGPVIQTVSVPLRRAAGLVADRPAPSAAVELDAPAPNPATGQATIRYRLAQPGHVTLEAFSVTGHRVAMYLDAAQPAGMHIVEIATALPAGTYMLVLTSNGVRSAQRLVVDGR